MHAKQAKQNALLEVEEIRSSSSSSSSSSATNTTNTNTVYLNKRNVFVLIFKRNWMNCLVIVQVEHQDLIYLPFSSHKLHMEDLLYLLIVQVLKVNVLWLILEG